MYRDKTVAVVVPAYNEEPFVASVIETLPDYVDRVYAVDDASTDDTWQEIRAAAHRVNDVPQNGNAFERRVIPIRHEENRGVGGAIKTGYLRAREDGIDVTVVVGGDAQMDPDAMADVIEPVVSGEADYAKGNRLLDPDYYDDMPRFRYLGNRILTVLTQIASGYWSIGDPQNGYTAISLEALETIDVESMYEFYGYCNDLLVKCSVNDLRVVDVPHEATYDDEESHIDYRTYVPRVSGMLARNFLWRMAVCGRQLSPVALFVALAAVTGLGGLTRAIRGDDGEQGGAGSSLAVAATSALAALALDRERDDHLDEQVDPEPQLEDADADEHEHSEPPTIGRKQG